MSGTNTLAYYEHSGKRFYNIWPKNQQTIKEKVDEQRKDEMEKEKEKICVFVEKKERERERREREKKKERKRGLRQSLDKGGGNTDTEKDI